MVKNSGKNFEDDLLKLDEEIGNRCRTKVGFRGRTFDSSSPHRHFGYDDDSPKKDHKTVDKHTIHSISYSSDKSSPGGHYKHHSSTLSDLWIDGLLCAYEFITTVKKKPQVSEGKFGQKSESPKEIFPADIKMGELVSKRLPDTAIKQSTDAENDLETSHIHNLRNYNEGSDDDSSGRDYGHGGAVQYSHHTKALFRNQWVPIGWARITELVEYVQRHSMPSSDHMLDPGSESDYGLGYVADQAAPFTQSQKGPIWWCHVLASHPHIVEWLSHAQWLDPAITSGLRDESRLISERMKHLFYEVPVRVGGGLLFELLGHSVGDPHRNEDDVPIVLRSFTSLNFLITAIHVKGSIPYGLNVIGISDVQDLIRSGGESAPRSAHEVVTSLADRLARWDDRLFRKHYFGVADEVELKFVSRKGDEDLAVLSIILNHEIRRLSTQVIRVKWALHAREEISYELLARLRGTNAQAVLKRIATSTRAMLEEHEAVCDRLFTLQDVMQSTFHASLQDTSVRIMHNLAVIGGGGLFLTIIVGLFGTNLRGIPGQKNTPHAFWIFTVTFFAFGVLVMGLAMKFLRFRKSPTEEQLASRKKELQSLVRKFQNAAETHEKVGK
ncbi:unnamed protein product [Calypogeia fissa]